MSPHRLTAVLLLSALSIPVAQAQHSHAASSEAPVSIPARVDIPLTPETWQSLPRHEVHADAHGKLLNCSGVSLAELFQHVKAMPAPPLHGPQLARIIHAQARDGYQVSFSLGELDPGLGKREILLVDRCDGKALDADDGPLRLIVPGDERPARGIRQLDRLTVVLP